VIAPNGVPSLAYVIGTYPLLTTTFVDREIEQVERQGGDVTVLSLRRPNRMLSDGQRETMDRVIYVLPVSPLRVLAAHLRFLVTHPVRMASVFVHLGTRPHDSVRARIRTILHTGLGVVVADTLRRHPVGHIHAHFVDRATVVAWVSARLLDVPFSATAHANDIYVEPVMLVDKMCAAKFIVTCTEYNLVHLQRTLGEHEATIAAIHHGIDLDGFPPPRLGGAETMILAVGQLKEKKGFRYLLQAVATLARPEVRVVIAGDGPLRSELESEIVALGLQDRVTLAGAVPHDEVLRLMQRAAIFVLPAVVAADGDRDGIPNVILEAMAMSLPVISTRHSGIPEAVVDGTTGLLVEPGDAAALAAAIRELLDDPETAARMGGEGRTLVGDRFDLRRNVEALLQMVRS
jgi:colanic acid/amylovoran biosynthesis glycosyltransferase